MSDKIVSIVIVSWNTLALLRRCLQSIERAGDMVRGDLEVVVVDNASSDGTVDVLSREFVGVTFIANASNRGFAAATNQGIEATVGRYVVLVNPDTELKRSSLTELIRVAETRPTVGAVGPRLMHEDGTLQESCFPLPTVGREFWRLFHLDRVLRIAAYRMEEWSLQEPRRVEAVQGACLLVKREVFAAIGLLDERFYMYTEEIDLCRRMGTVGWEVYWVPRAQVVHHGGQSSRQVAKRMFLELYRSKIEYFRKHSGRFVCGLYKFVLFGAILPRVIVPPIAVALWPHHGSQLRAIVDNYRALLVALPTL